MLQCCFTALSDCIILSHLPSGDADASDDLSIGRLEGDSTGEGYEVVIAELNSMRICPCFAVVVEDLRFHFKEGGCLRFLDGHVDYSKPCSIHAMERLQVASRIKDGDADCNSEFARFQYGSLQDAFRLLCRNLHASGSLGRLVDSTRPWYQVGVHGSFNCP